MYFVFITVTLFLALLGAIIRFGKASWMVAGYNTSSKDEKAKIDEVAMCEFVGNLLFTLAGLVVLFGVAAYIKSVLMIVIISILFMVVIFGAVIYMNTGNRFKL